MKNNDTVHNCLDSDLVETGEKIRALRESRGMSQERLAECIGVSKNSISRYETGVADIKASILFDISEVLKTTPNELAPDKYKFNNIDQERIMGIVSLMQQVGEEKQQIIYLTVKAMISAFCTDNNTIILL